MAKKKIRTQKKFFVVRPSVRTKYIGAGALALITTLVLGATVGPWANTFGAKKLRALFATAQPLEPLPPPANPSKEYIYAGGKLIATEEPGASLAAPAGLVANTLSHLQPSQVQVNWEPTAGADHYEVERTTNVNTSYTTITSNVTSTTFTDATVSSVTAYLYRVRAVGAGGSVSPYSGIDLATAISFSDDTLQIGSTPIRAAHFNELRQAVNAVRATTANLDQVIWAESIVAGTPTVPGTPVRASHILELRTKLDQALSSLILPACTYTSAAAGDSIQKLHVEQLRQCVK
jgi:hypothetical protein